MLCTRFPKYLNQNAKQIPITIHCGNTGVNSQGRHITGQPIMNLNAPPECCNCTSQHSFTCLFCSRKAEGCRLVVLLVSLLCYDSFIKWAVPRFILKNSKVISSYMRSCLASFLISVFEVVNTHINGKDCEGSVLIPDNTEQTKKNVRRATVLLGNFGPII